MSGFGDQVPEGYRSENLEDLRWLTPRVRGPFTEEVAEGRRERHLDARVQNEIWNLLESWKNSIKSRFDDPEKIPERMSGAFRAPKDAGEALRRLVGWDQNWHAPNDWDPPEWMGQLLHVLTKSHYHDPQHPMNEPNKHYPRWNRESPWDGMFE